MKLQIRAKLEALFHLYYLFPENTAKYDDDDYINDG